MATPSDLQLTYLRALALRDLATEQPAPVNDRTGDDYIPGSVAGVMARAGWAKRTKPFPRASFYDVSITDEGRAVLAGAEET